MIKIEYSHSSYEELLRNIARALQTKIAGNSVAFTPVTGEGNIKLVVLNNNLEILVNNYKPLEDIVFTKKKGPGEFYTFRINDVAETAGAARSMVLFGASVNERVHLAPANMWQRSISVNMSKEFLQKMLSREEMGDTLLNFISLKTPAYHYDPLDVEYRRLLAEINPAEQISGFEKIIIQNRIMLVMERFFTRLCKKITDEHARFNMSGEEIGRIRQVEQKLVSDFTNPPPSLAQLSRMAAMSPSKLKILFKKMYGLPVYQYFQKARMNKAKAMLTSKKYTLHQVALELGYNTVNELSKTFKKTFDQLPADI